MAKPRVRHTIDISAIQLRRAGDALQVLVETDGVWRLAITRPWPSDGAGLVSEIAEVNGKFGWPLVEPSAPPPATGRQYLASSYNCKPCQGCGLMRMENCSNPGLHGHEWCDCQ